MRTHASAVDTHAADAFDFVADAERLPIWAIGFALVIEPDGDR